MPRLKVLVCAQVDNHIPQASVASVATFAISLYLSKCAVICFLRRLTKVPSQVRLYWIAIAIISAIGLASVLLVTVEWPLDSGFYWAFYKNGTSCTTQVRRSQDSVRQHSCLHVTRRFDGVSSLLWTFSQKSSSPSSHSTKCGTYRWPAARRPP